MFFLSRHNLISEEGFFLAYGHFEVSAFRSIYDTCFPLLVWQTITPSEVSTWHRGTGGSSLPPRRALFIRQQKTLEVITLFIHTATYQRFKKYHPSIQRNVLFANCSATILSLFLGKLFGCYIHQIESLWRMISSQKYLMGFCKENKCTSPKTVVWSDVPNCN